jgi:hypothetical protein
LYAKAEAQADASFQRFNNFHHSNSIEYYFQFVEGVPGFEWQNAMDSSGSVFVTTVLEGSRTENRARMGTLLSARMDLMLPGLEEVDRPLFVRSWCQTGHS